MPRKVAIVDYGMGNLDSIARAVEECGGSPVVTSEERDFKAADSIIVPGIGSFADGMRNVCALGLDKMLEREAKKGIPLLGICLGMQFLATVGFEGGETRGFGWIEGEVKKLEPKEPHTKIPHIGWNEVRFVKSHRLFNGVPAGKDFYFVHSYHVVCKNEEDVIARTAYGGDFVSAIQKGNILGVQFHPEKSQRFGLRVIRNFLSF